MTFLRYLLSFFRPTAPVHQPAPSDWDEAGRALDADDQLVEIDEDGRIWTHGHAPKRANILRDPEGEYGHFATSGERQGGRDDGR